MLRQQLRIVERKQERGPSIPRWQKIPLVALALRLREQGSAAHQRLKRSIILFKPETVLGWHRELVRRKWTFDNSPKRGRPAISPEIEDWIVKIARENAAFGYDKIEGEMRKLGFEVSASTVRSVLKKHGIAPAPERGAHGSTWQTFLNHYKDQFFACDFFTVETLFLQTIYVLFFIEHGSRRVHIAGCTGHPEKLWVTQQARQMTWILEDYDLAMRFLIHDNDTKFSRAFDIVFKAISIEIINTPRQAPNANAFAERWVRSVREECLDKLIIVNETHLRRVLREYVANYNSRRPHQGIAQSSPNGFTEVDTSAPIRCQQVLGGIIRDYYREAA